MKNLKLLLSLVAGLLLTASFAPFNFSDLAPLSLALALLSWQHSSQKQAIFLGLAFGLGFFGSSVYWVAISIYRYGGADLGLALAITIGFILVLSILPICQVVLYSAFYRQNAIFTWIFFPLSWLLCEWIRANAFTGFPWVLLGVSQVSSPLAGYASIGNVYFASLMTVLAASFIFSFFTDAKLNIKLISLLGLILIYLAGAIALHFASVPKFPQKFTVALVQGNVPQELKWDPSATDWIMDHYEKLSMPYLKKANLIIWPEGSLDSEWPWSQHKLRPFLENVSLHHTALIFGSPATNEGLDYNAMILAAPHTQVYYKRHLVPLGEYMPLADIVVPILRWLHFPTGSFAAGDAHQALLEVDGVKIAPFICYEITYPKLLRQNTESADLLLVISDDGWFGQSVAAAQHLESAQMAAIITHRPLIFVSNTGVTAVIDARGHILHRLPRNVTQVLETSLP